MSRRDFLDRAQKYAVGALPRQRAEPATEYAFAQQVPKDDARIKTEYLTYPSPEAGTTRLRVRRARQAARRGSHP
jgi:carboxymethylenebutenolidase